MFPKKELTLGHTCGPFWAPIFWAASFEKSKLFWCLGARRLSSFFSEMHNTDAAQAAKAGKRLMRLNG